MDSMYKHNHPDPDKLTMMTIAFITDHITNEVQTELQNSKLSAWIQLYRVEDGIQQVPKIKLREKGPALHQVMWNY